MAFNKKIHLRQNIDALKTAFTLDRERRAPTPEEERTLGAYSGFGAIKEVLENPTGKPDKDGMATLVAELQEVIRANTPDERCNLQIFLCLFLEKLNMPQNTPVTKAS